MENNFKGTKGEWKFNKIDKDSNGYINVEIPHGFIAVYNGIEPYNFKENRDKCVEILEANAKLIAYAPELLKNAISVLNNNLNSEKKLLETINKII